MKEIELITEKQVLFNIVNLRQLVFEVTELCNLRCKYCGYADLYNSFEERNTGNMHIDQAKVLIDYLQTIWEKYPIKETNKIVYVSFYGGEPLVNIRLIKQIIAYLENLPNTGRRFQFSMTTNAMLLDKNMDFLVEKDFQLLISLDGDEYGHSYRVDSNGNNSFYTVYKNLKLLQESYPNYFASKLNFNSVLHNRNSVEKIYNYIYSEFGKIPIISELNTSNVKENKREEFNNMFNSEVKSEEEANDSLLKDKMFSRSPSVKSLINYIYDYSGNIFSNYTSLLLHENNDRIVSGTCSPFSKKMFLAVNGKILPCERVSHQFAFGEIQGDKVLLDLKEVVAAHNKYISAFKNQCERCALSNKCPQCVYQMDETITNSHICTHIQTKERKEANNSKVLSYLRENPSYYKKILNEITIRK